MKKRRSPGGESVKASANKKTRPSPQANPEPVWTDPKSLDEYMTRVENACMLAAKNHAAGHRTLDKLDAFFYQMQSVNPDFFRFVESTEGDPDSPLF
jgi:hypothetical protein